MEEHDARILIYPAMTKAAGACILALLFAAPLCFGGTTNDAILSLECVTAAAGLLWGVDLVRQRRWPSIPLPVVCAAFWILLQGWWMAYNAKSVFDESFMTFAGIPAKWKHLPGASDGPAAFHIMVRISALMTVLFVTCDLAASTRWTRKLVTCLALSGIATALIGIWQKSSHNSLKIWPVDEVPDTVFGSYWYHGNAGALLNMAWPLVLGQVVWCFQGEGRHLEKALWTVSLFAMLAGVLLNVSKAGHAIACVLGFLALMLMLLRLKPLVAEIGWKHFAAYTTLILAALVVLIVMIEPDRSITRWKEYLARAGSDSRLVTGRAALQMLPEGGMFGFGPGSFKGAFNERMVALGEKPVAIWRYAHNDPLQYVFEWGYIGAIAWVVIWLLPLKFAIKNLYGSARAALGLEPKRTRRSRQRWDRSYESLRQHLLQGVGIGLIGVLIHACIDFPLQIMSLQLWALALAGILIASPGSNDTV
jgi:hypothetical protein